MTAKPTRCLYCSRFTRAGVTRCPRCDAKAAAIRARLLASRPVVRTLDTRGCDCFATASVAYDRVRRSVIGSLVIGAARTEATEIALADGYEIYSDE